jgi:hypothetical protein
VSQDGLKSEHEEEAMQAHLEDVGSGLAPVSAAWFVVNVAAWLTSTGSPTSAPTCSIVSGKTAGRSSP